MLEYLVKLSYNAQFSFDDGHTAMTFAQLVANKRIEEQDDVMMIIHRKEEKDDETDNV